MATRLNYALPIARQLLLSASRRFRPGGLAACLPASEEGRSFIMVTGAGRSGTSAVARVLHESGVKMGANFAASSEFNPVGFYEDAAVRDLNERIMTESGMARLERWPWRSTVMAVAANYGEEMEALAAEAADGWKDPQFSITLEAWLPHLSRPPKLVVCLRSPDAYADSVVRRYALVTQETVQRRWWKQYRRLLAVIRDYRLEATCVEYDQLVQHPEETVASLSEFVGYPLEAKYVEPALRQFMHPVPQAYAALHQEVRSLGGATIDDAGAAAFQTGHVARPERKARSMPSLLARLGKRGRLTDEGARAIDGYLQSVRAIDSQVATAKAHWSDRVGAPRLRLADYRELGLDLSEVVEEAHAASAAYVSALSEAQAELGSLPPPAAFERYHEFTRATVDRERLVAQLMLKATDSPHPEQRALNDALRAWRLFSSPEAASKAQEHRSRENDRALKASGYQAVQPETERS